MNIIEETHNTDSNNQLIIGPELFHEFGIHAGDSVRIAFLGNKPFGIVDNEFLITKDGFKNSDSEDYIYLPDELLAAAGVESSAMLNIACIDHAIIVYQPELLSLTELEDVLSSLNIVNQKAEEGDEHVE